MTLNEAYEQYDAENPLVSGGSGPYVRTQSFPAWMIEKVVKLQRENADLREQIQHWGALAAENGLTADELRAKLAAAEADTRRLDWIIQRSNTTEDQWLDEDVWDRIPGFVDAGPEEAIREAIDAAMDAQKGGVK